MMVDRTPLPDWSDIIAQRDAEIARLRAVLQRVRRWGSPMVRGYIDGALAGSDRGIVPVAHGPVGEVDQQEAVR